MGWDRARAGGSVEEAEGERGPTRRPDSREMLGPNPLEQICPLVTWLTAMMPKGDIGEPKELGTDAGWAAAACRGRLCGLDSSPPWTRSRACTVPREGAGWRGAPVDGWETPGSRWGAPVLGRGGLEGPADPAVADEAAGAPCP